MAVPSPLSSLQEIRRLANGMKQRFKPLHIAQPANLSVDLDFEFELPDPEPIDSALILTGISLEVSQKASETFLRLVSTYKSSIVATFRKTALALSNNGPAQLDQLRSTMRAIYLKRIHEWKQKAVAKAAERLRVCRPNNRLSRPKQIKGFNQEFTPFLLKYFEHNAYPSTADRHLMAKKSMMHPDQIKNWFQNHRTRSKREGKALAQLKDGDVSKLELSSLEKEMKHYVVPAHQRKETVDPYADEYEWQYYSDEEDVSAIKPKYERIPGAVDILSPPAGPKTYPNNQVDFIFRDGAYEHVPLPSLVWHRRASTSTARSPIAAEELEKLCDAFARLKVQRGPEKCWVKKVPSNPRLPQKPKRTSAPLPGPDKSAATASITTKLPVGRHPAFVLVDRESIKKFTFRITPPMPATTMISPVPIPAVNIQHNVFKVPRPESPMATLVSKTLPINITSSTSGRRKARLPKRVPQGTSIMRGGAPASPGSVYPYGYSSPRTPSRTPSLESDSFSTPSPSSSRNVSDALMTPPDGVPLGFSLALPGSAPAIALPGSAVPQKISLTEELNADLPEELYADLFGDEGLLSQAALEQDQEHNPESWISIPGVVDYTSEFNFSNVPYFSHDNPSFDLQSNGYGDIYQAQLPKQADFEFNADEFELHFSLS